MGKKILDNYNSCITVSGKPVFYDGFMWLVSAEFDLLLKYDFAGTTLLNRYKIPGKSVFWGHLNIVAFEKKLFIFPLYGYGIFIFDPNDASFQKINIEKYMIDCKKERYDIVESIGNKLIFIESNSNHVFEYTDVDRTIRCVDQKLSDCLKINGIDTKSPIFTTEYCRVKDLLYIPIDNLKSFIIFDLKSYDASLVDIKTEGKVWSVCGNENCVLFTTTDGEVVTWKKDSISSIRDLSYLSNEKSILLKPVCVRDKVFYFSWKGREYYMDENDNIIKTELPFMSTDTRYPAGAYYQFQWVYTNEEMIYVQSRINGDIFVIDSLTNGVNILRLPFPQNEVSGLIKDVCKEGGYNPIMEDDAFTLDSLLGLCGSDE
ncbi:MAG: hypothetical protein K6E49_07140 [Lachnospiraceae bacterium]|nr:hypothetical protein [Lachnospiraceae bacterium]